MAVGGMRERARRGKRGTYWGDVWMEKEEDERCGYCLGELVSLYLSLRHILLGGLIHLFWRQR